MNNLIFAPVLLFTFKRLDVLKLTVAALQQNFHANESELFIFSDAPRRTDEERLVSQVREFIRTVSGFKKIHIFEADKNKGLAKSIIEGATQVINEHRKLIVLEDDLITSPNFLSYMNQALNFYQGNLKVFSIAGYTIPVTVPKEHLSDGYFLPRASSWGWATWKDRWDNVDWKMTSFDQFKNDKKQIKAFNKGGSDMYEMLKKQMEGEIDSWAIRWCYNQFRAGSYTLYPVVSKVKNVGFNNMATHTNVFNRYDTKLDEEAKTSFIFPSQVAPYASLLSQFQNFYSLKTRALGKIKTYLYKAGLYKNK